MQRPSRFLSPLVLAATHVLRVTAALAEPATNFNSVPEPSFTPPPALQAFFDTSFGTKITRLTDENTLVGGTPRNWCSQAYDYWESMSADDRYIYLACDSTGILLRLDPNTDTVTPDGPLNDGTHNVSWQSAQWSMTEPHVLYGMSGRVLQKIAVGPNTGQRTFTEVKNFNSVWQAADDSVNYTDPPSWGVVSMSKSDDDAVFTFLTSLSTGPINNTQLDATIYNRPLDRTFKYSAVASNLGLHDVAIDKTGRHILLIASTFTRNNFSALAMPCPHDHLLTFDEVAWNKTCSSDSDCDFGVCSSSGSCSNYDASSHKSCRSDADCIGTCESTQMCSNAFLSDVVLSGRAGGATCNAAVLQSLSLNDWAYAGHSDIGRSGIVNQDTVNGGIVFRAFDRLDQPTPILNTGMDGAGQHLSLRTGSELEVTYEAYHPMDTSRNPPTSTIDPAWPAFQDEIAIVRSTGAGFMRLAHHHSRFEQLTAAEMDGDIGFWSQPRAVPDHLGRYLVFASNYGTHHVDTYILKIPSFPSHPVAGPNWPGPQWAFLIDDSGRLEINDLGSATPHWVRVSTLGLSKLAGRDSLKAVILTGGLSRTTDASGKHDSVFMSGSDGGVYSMFTDSGLNQAPLSPTWAIARIPTSTSTAASCVAVGSPNFILSASGELFGAVRCADGTVDVFRQTTAFDFGTIAAANIGRALDGTAAGWSIVSDPEPFFDAAAEKVWAVAGDGNLWEACVSCSPVTWTKRNRPSSTFFAGAPGGFSAGANGSFGVGATTLSGELVGISGPPISTSWSTMGSPGLSDCAIGGDVRIAPTGSVLVARCGSRSVNDITTWQSPGPDYLGWFTASANSWQSPAYHDGYSRLSQPTIAESFFGTFAWLKSKRSDGTTHVIRVGSSGSEYDSGGPALTYLLADPKVIYQKYNGVCEPPEGVLGPAPGDSYSYNDLRALGTLSVNETQALLACMSDFGEPNDSCLTFNAIKDEIGSGDPCHLLQGGMPLHKPGGSCNANLLTSSANCGWCGHDCGDFRQCVNGTCVAGTSDIDTRFNFTANEAGDLFVLADNGHAYLVVGGASTTPTQATDWVQLPDLADSAYGATIKYGVVANEPIQDWKYVVAVGSDGNLWALLWHIPWPPTSGPQWQWIALQKPADCGSIVGQPATADVFGYYMAVFVRCSADERIYELQLPSGDWLPHEAPCTDASGTQAVQCGTAGAVPVHLTRNPAAATADTSDTEPFGAVVAVDTNGNLWGNIWLVDPDGSELHMFGSGPGSDWFFLGKPPGGVDVVGQPALVNTNHGPIWALFLGSDGQAWDMHIDTSATPTWTPHGFPSMPHCARPDGNGFSIATDGGRNNFIGAIRCTGLMAEDINSVARLEYDWNGGNATWRWEVTEVPAYPGSSSSGVYLWGDPYAVAYKWTTGMGTDFDFEVLFQTLDPTIAGQVLPMSWKGAAGANGATDPWNVVLRAAIE